MGDKTGIEWTDATWNPVVGCQHTSPGCDNCYAAREAAGRLAHLPQYEGLAIKEAGKPAEFTGIVRCLPERLGQPLAWKRPRRIFVNSMSDLFHHDVPVEFIAKVYAVMAVSTQHTFQVLTKRPHRMAAVLSSPDFVASVCSEILALAGISAEQRDAAWKWPLPNVWLGTSIESDRYCFRADRLRETPAAVRFISAEPLLGPLPSLDLTGIDWLIVGGESGPGARAMHPEWVRELRDQCVDITCPECGQRLEHGDPDFGICTWCNGEPYGTAFLFKQWGEYRGFAPEELADGLALAAASGRPHKDWTNAAHERDDLDAAARDGFTSVRIGKKEAGRELDGRTWDEFPTVVAR